MKNIRRGYCLPHRDLNPMVRATIILACLAPFAVRADDAGQFTGQYGCGANSGEGARSSKAYSVPVRLRIDGDKVSGTRDTAQTLEVFSGDVDAAGKVSVTFSGGWKDDPKRTWIVRFDGTVAPANLTAVGGMYSRDGKTKVRDCTLSLEREKPSGPATERQVANQSGIQASTATAGANAVAQKLDKAFALSVSLTAPSPARATRVEFPTSTASAVNAGSWLGTVPPLFVDKKQLLDAATRGDLAGIGNISDEHSPDAKALVASVAYILANDYKTPVPSEDSYCVVGASAAIFRALKVRTTEYTETLEAGPPSFQRVSRRLGGQKSLDPLVGLRSTCSYRVLGQPHVYPAMDSLTGLLDEYGHATSQYVETRRAKLVAAYEAEQKAKLEAAANAEAVRQAAEQQRIDTERKRIDDDQQRKQQRDAARISG